jgi:pimeloyl-ACP methyl ester carboxylesterase
MILRKGSRAAFIERAKLEGQDYTELLYTIKSPTLIIWGEDDLWIPVEDGFKFKERMANSNLVIMKETGHVPMEEKPLESVALALNFLNLEIENENFLKE